MTFSEKLTGLRRKSGMSQEQLADRLGVTRQSVSKWEGGTAMPELVKLISLSELFGVSVDYLVKDWLEEPDNPCGGSGEISSKQADRLEKKVDELTNYVKGRVYRYDSKTRIFGLPLVSIRFGFVRNGKLSMDNTAKGIIAIGNCAIGVVAIGIVGVGLFTFGVLAMGMLSLGIVAGGLAAFGVGALGDLAPLDDGFYRPEDLHMMPQEQFLRMVRTFGPHRILFGTDSPWQSQTDAVAAIRALPLSQEEQDGILGGNAQKLLNFPNM